MTLIPIEDLVTFLAMRSITNPWEMSVLQSFYEQICRGQGFTEKQSALALKLLRKHLQLITGISPTDVQYALDNPTYKFGVRKLNSSIKASIINHPTWIKAIKFEFPFNQSYIEKIKENKQRLNSPIFDGNVKAWLFPLTEECIHFVNTLVNTDAFEKDEEFAQYAHAVNNVMESLNSYIPMLSLDNEIPTYKNTPPQIPELLSQNIVDALFEARRAGIFTWDASVNEKLLSLEIDPIITSFLNFEGDDAFYYVDSTKNEFSSMKSLIKHLGRGVFLIPADSEFTKLTMIYDSLKGQGYEDSEMSVLFRLPSDSGSKFNDFVKNNHLNDPISDKTKFVFICTKVPKTILKSDIKFNFIMNLGYVNIHYTVREYMKNCQNVIYYSDKKPHREKYFVYM